MIVMKDPNKSSKPSAKPKEKNEKKYTRGIFKKTRGGVPLTKEEVKEIKAGRKKLRAELRKIGEKDKKEFELTASSLGLYFDHNRIGAIFKWFFVTKGMWILLVAGILLLLIIWGIAYIAELKGHFTVNMSRDMFKKGFSISEDADFEIKTSHLFATPAVDVPCISIVDIPENVNEIDGEHNGNYFAYTFYLRNEGETSADYQWELRLNSPSALSKAAWVMVFVDGEMTLYAKPNEDGTSAALPVWNDNTIGYLKPPLYEYAADKNQYEIIYQYNTLTYWRVIPKPFLDENAVAAGTHIDVQPAEVHKYTIVLWLEGDDPDCTEELIGESLGLEMYMAMIEKEEEGE